VRCFGTLEPPRGPTPPQPPVRMASPGSVVERDPVRRARDGARTCFESRIAIPSAEEPEEILTPTRRFTVLETTSGLPDDSREADERQAERRLRDLHARVKLARAVVSRTSGLAEILETDWKRAARFYTRFGITEETFRYGVSAGGAAGDSGTDGIWQPMNSFTEAREQIEVVLPSPELP
jgi:hypothetical protein